MRFSWTRVGAILRKELRDYRRNRFVIVTMTMVPVAFIIAPMIQLFVANATADTSRDSPLDPVGLLGGRRARAGHA